MVLMGMVKGEYGNYKKCHLGRVKVVMGMVKGDGGNEKKCRHLGRVGCRMPGGRLPAQAV